ncbi:unnamed protein product [Paramecium sonneborni]|uniref:Uncharacterized protein n=1 Tax=Paramecium sonneborni TaxID=65129 RepID=A0A8S1RC68_9CILI|nr:unnamed protein product [Paramecium sonneborni]
MLMYIDDHRIRLWKKSRFYLKYYNESMCSDLDTNNTLRHNNNLYCLIVINSIQLKNVQRNLHMYGMARLLLIQFVAQHLLMTLMRNVKHFQILIVVSYNIEVQCKFNTKGEVCIWNTNTDPVTCADKSCATAPNTSFSDHHTYSVYLTRCRCKVNVFDVN